MSRVFVVGQSQDQFTRWRCENEQKTFGDLLVDKNFLDSYRNLTRKVTSSLFWAASRPWSDLRYVVKIDSDCFVKVTDLSALTKRLMKSENEPHVVGYAWGEKHPVVNRDKKSKWYLSKKEYPHRFFPPYADGPSYMLSFTALQRMMNAETLQEIKTNRALFIEDVYVTGIVRQRLNIKLINHRKLFWLKNIPALVHIADFAAFASKNFVAAHGSLTANHFLKLQAFIDEPKISKPFI